jgi:hypothetical protein
MVPVGLLVERTRAFNRTIKMMVVQQYAFT